MSYSPISVETVDNPNAIEDVEFVIQMPENATDMDDLKAKLDDVLTAVNEVDLSLAAQIQEVEIGLGEEILKLKKYLTKLIKEEISIAFESTAPPRRLVPAKQPRIPESAVDLRSSDDDEPPPKSKKSKYIEK